MNQVCSHSAPKPIGLAANSRKSADRTSIYFFFVYSLCTRMRPRKIMARRMYSPFPGRSPREAAQCRRPFALRPGLSREDEKAHQGGYKGKKQRRDVTPPSLLLSSRCHERGGWKEQRGFLPVARLAPSTQRHRLRLPFLFPLPSLSELPFRRPAPRVISNFHSRHYLPHVRRGEEI